MSAPTQYRRYDWRTPGGWMKESGSTPKQAAGLFDIAYNARPGTLASRVTTLAQKNPFGVVRGELNQDRQYHALNQEGRLAQAQPFLQRSGLTPASDVNERAMAYDAYQRGLQQQNQMPKNSRGFMGSTLGKVLRVGLPMALGAGFGAPGFISGAFNAAGAGAALPAFNTVQGVKSAVDVARAFK